MSAFIQQIPLLNKLNWDTPMLVAVAIGMACSIGFLSFMSWYGAEGESHVYLLCFPVCYGSQDDR